MIYLHTQPEHISSPRHDVSPTHNLHFGLFSLRPADCSFQEPLITPVYWLFFPAENSIYVNVSALYPINNVISFLRNTWVLNKTQTLVWGNSTSHRRHSMFVWLRALPSLRAPTTALQTQAAQSVCIWHYSYTLTSSSVDSRKHSPCMHLNIWVLYTVL